MHEPPWLTHSGQSATRTQIVLAALPARSTEAEKVTRALKLPIQIDPPFQRTSDPTRRGILATGLMFWGRAYVSAIRIQSLELLRSAQQFGAAG
jgi:hypothetical protein